jgi:hypothetical protein
MSVTAHPKTQCYNPEYLDLQGQLCQRKMIRLLTTDPWKINQHARSQLTLGIKTQKNTDMHPRPKLVNFAVNFEIQNNIASAHSS